MTVAVELAPRALRDVLDCSIWWAKHHPGDANHFDEELDKAIERIKQWPESSPRGRVRRFRTARVHVMRETGHLVVYRVKSKTLVEIVAVLASRKTTTRP